MIRETIEKMAEVIKKSPEEFRKFWTMEKEKKHIHKLHKAEIISPEKFAPEEIKMIEQYTKEIKGLPTWRKGVLRAEMLILEPYALAIPSVRRLLKLGKEAFKRAKLEEVGL